MRSDRTTSFLGRLSPGHMRAEFENRGLSVALLVAVCAACVLALCSQEALADSLGTLPPIVAPLPAGVTPHAGSVQHGGARDIKPGAGSDTALATCWSRERSSSTACPDRRFQSGYTHRVSTASRRRAYRQGLGARHASGGQKSGRICASPARCAPVASSSRPSGPASKARLDPGATRIASSLRTS